MNKTPMLMLILCGMVLADTFTFQISGASNSTGTLTVEDWQIGYGAQEINNNGVENMVGEILILAGVALVYIAYTTRGEKHGTN
jgi:hypothetical protein